MRAAVDTNVWVSAVLNPKGLPRRVYSAYLARAFTLVLSAPLLEELADVLNRPRLVRAHQRSADEIAAFIADLRAGAELVDVTDAVEVCRDPDDNALNTASRGAVSQWGG